MGDSPVVIDIENLTLRYGSYTAVDGLSLELRRGELFGLLGPNGAGKSSTVRVLIGQRPPTEGSVRILGLDIVHDWPKIKPLFGYVPDGLNHFDEFTGRRNLLFFAGLYQVPPPRVDECLAVVELTEAADKPVGGYSLGMRRKLLLARALLHDPPILYLDEPTANLDSYSSALVRRILRDRVRQGNTVLMTTHNMDEVEEICDRVAILRKGRLVALDTPLNLRQKHLERRIDVTLQDGRRLIMNLADEADRTELAGHVSRGQVACVETREFDFEAAFRKLTEPGPG
jgi:ABC-type multidrug transport system ATPase subunit